MVYVANTGVLVPQAIAWANIKCTSSGNAVACGEAMVSANAWARAAASAHGEAVYNATSADCNCTNPTAIEGFALSSKLVDLISQATSHAEVQACSRDGLEASAEAFTDCTAVAYVQIFAASVADVVLEGARACIGVFSCPQGLLVLGSGAGVSCDLSCCVGYLRSTCGGNKCSFAGVSVQLCVA